MSGPGETPKLVGWWRFDENGGSSITDRSGSGNEGIVSRDLRRGPGPLAGSLEFDGLGYVQGTDAGKSFPLGDSPFTISAWLNCTHEPATGGTIFHFGTVGWRPPRSNMFLHLSPEGKATFGFAFGYEALVGARNLADGRWHHLAAFYTGGSARRAEVYADGEGEAAGVLTDPPNLGSGSPWTIGVSQGGSPPFEGRLADVRLYRGALSAPFYCGLIPLRTGGSPAWSCLAAGRATTFRRSIARPSPRSLQRQMPPRLRSGTMGSAAAAWSFLPRRMGLARWRI